MDRFSVPLCPEVHKEGRWMMTMKDEYSFVAKVAARELKRKLKKSNKRKKEDKDKK